ARQLHERSGAELTVTASVGAGGWVLSMSSWGAGVVVGGGGTCAPGSGGWWSMPGLGAEVVARWAGEPRRGPLDGAGFGDGSPWRRTPATGRPCGAAVAGTGQVPGHRAPGTTPWSTTRTCTPPSTARSSPGTCDHHAPQPDH